MRDGKAQHGTSKRRVSSKAQYHHPSFNQPEAPAQPIDC